MKKKAAREFVIGLIDEKDCTRKEFFIGLIGYRREYIKRL